MVILAVPSFFWLSQVGILMTMSLGCVILARDGISRSKNDLTSPFDMTYLFPGSQISNQPSLFELNSPIFKSLPSVSV